MISTPWIAVYSVFSSAAPAAATPTVVRSSFERTRLPAALIYIINSHSCGILPRRPICDVRHQSQHPSVFLTQDRH
ncbi:hypothetical protein B0H34DRAFT_727380, partial [Crassisporium funariophilum]